MSPSSGKHDEPRAAGARLAEQGVVALEVGVEVTEPRRDLGEGDPEWLHALILSFRGGH